MHLQLVGIIRCNILCLLLCIVNYSFSQDDEIVVEGAFQKDDTAVSREIIAPEEVELYIRSQSLRQDERIIGGYVSSIFHESIDGAAIAFSIDGKVAEKVYTHEGVFKYIETHRGKVLDLTISHPDFHPQDTTILLDDSSVYILRVALEPKYKILLRGRVYAGNMPLEGANVEVRHAGESFQMRTMGCYYDNEDYWNCLYIGMFKFNITTDNLDDSVQLYLTMNGMKTLKHGMIIHEYQGEIMKLKMEYESNLPKVSLNNFNLKLGFPFASNESDWFVSLSYYRLINHLKLRRFAYGLEGNIYVSNIIETHSTFTPNLKATADSSYIDGFIGPSILLWILPPEKRHFSSYAGLTFALGFDKMKFTYQPFLGTRFFLDMNKAISIELRYTDFNRDIVHYTFNPYGNAHKYFVSERLIKLHANMGIQIIF